MSDLFNSDDDNDDDAEPYVKMVAGKWRASSALSSKPKKEAIITIVDENREYERPTKGDERLF